MREMTLTSPSAVQVMPNLWQGSGWSQPAFGCPIDTASGIKEFVKDFRGCGLSDCPRHREDHRAEQRVEVVRFSHGEPQF